MSEPTARASRNADSAAAVLGIGGYALLRSSEQLAAASEQFEEIETRLALLSLLGSRAEQLNQINACLRECGVEPSTAMAWYRDTLDDFHLRTVPRDGLEMVVKIAVTEQLAADFLAELMADPGGSEVLDPVVSQLHAQPGDLSFVSEHIRQAVTDNPAVAGRLALWARRLLGEALSQAQRLLSEHEELAVAMRPADAPGTHLSTLNAIIRTLVARHDQQMRALALSA